MLRPLIIFTLLAVISAQRYSQYYGSYSQAYTRTREDYDEGSTPDFKAPDWMSFIEDQRSISKLSIPGTHASMSYTSDSTNRRQSWSLYKQYDAGIRFADFPCRLYLNNLYVYYSHGPVRHSLDSIMRETIRFLDDYPSETILMRIRREGTPSYTRLTMGEIVQRLLAKYPTYRIWTSNRIPTMEEARGKIVILQDFYSTYPIGVSYRSLNIEDSGNVRNVNAFDWKWQRVRYHLNSALRGNNYSMYITYTGGAGAGLEPKAVATRINRRLWDLILQWDGQQNRWGIIAMDFPGARLVKKIIDSNF